MRGVLWLVLCMCLLCVCAHADTSDAASEKIVTQELEPTTLRSLRQEKDAQANDDKDQSDQLRQGGAATAADDKQQPVGGRLIEKSGARAVHRVYDPVSGLYCELVGDCHPCPVSEKDEVYCRETSHLQELLCPRAPESNKVSDTNALLQDVRFKACVPEEKANPLLTVFLFEVTW
uniref:Uncharacterized protein n=1 Tax=Globisporangium ultimum (strain ATCC 200006 / CBS 805.95 / DAOM BR144) TaxID=431595 RepID=K3WT87_GLOUD